MPYSISLAARSERDIAALTSLWRKTFGDGDGFIRGFINDYLFPEYNVPVIRDPAGGIASALYMLDFSMYSLTRYVGEAAYLYAAATDDKYRSRGYMGELMDYSLDLYKKRGYCAVFLIPAEESLFAYYSRFGFLPVYDAEKFEFSANGFDARDGKNILLRSDLSDDETFSRLYELYAARTIKYPLAPLKGEYYFKRAAESYMDEENGGLFGRVESDGKIFCYIFYRITENSVLVDDITLEEGFDGADWGDVRAAIAASAARALDYSGKITVTAPGNKSPHAMLRPLNGEAEEICGRIAGGNAVNYINMFMNY